MVPGHRCERNNRSQNGKVKGENGKLLSSRVLSNSSCFLYPFPPPPPSGTTPILGVELVTKTPRSPSQGFSPERQFCGFKIHFTHTRNISPEREISVFRVLFAYAHQAKAVCVRKNNQRENRNIFHTESTEPTELFLRNEQNICYQMGIRIHRICRRLRHDGWRGGNENRKYFYLTHLNKAEMARVS